MTAELEDLFAGWKPSRHPVGHGTFSDVYKITTRPNDFITKKKFAAKCIVPWSSSTKILNEFKCLQKLGHEEHNVLQIFAAHRSVNRCIFVLQFCPHDRFSTWYNIADEEEIYSYIKNLLVALRYIHSFRVIHRDVKPGNFLYSRMHKRYCLADFGLAQVDQSRLIFTPQKLGNMATAVSQLSIQENRSIKIKSKRKRKSKRRLDPSFDEAPQPTKKRRVKVENNIVHTRGSLLKRKPSLSSTKPTCCNGKGEICNLCLVRTDFDVNKNGTPGFRSPEVLLRSDKQTTAVDMWSVGVITLSLLSSRYPFFHEVRRDDATSLLQIATLTGTKALEETANKLGRNLVTPITLPPLNLETLCFSLRVAPSVEDVSRNDIPHNAGKTVLCKQCAKSVKDMISERGCYCASSPPKRRRVVLSKQQIDSTRTQQYNQLDRLPILNQSIFKLLSALFEVNPDNRITAEQALQFDVFK